MTLHNGKADDPAIVLSDGVISYSELDAHVAMCVANFREAGIRAGHRVGLYQPLSSRYVVSLLALIEMGAAACPISTRLPESGMQDALSKIDADAVFYADRCAGMGGSAISPILFDAMRTDVIDEDGDIETLEKDRWATIVFTSGSSGTPKAAVHSLTNHVESALASNENILLAHGDRWLLSLPLYHVGGLGIVFRCLQAGAAMVLPDAETSLEDTLRISGISHISLVSTQLYRLLQDKEAVERLGGMKAVLMGGTAMPSRLIDQALEAGIPIHTSYGMTEMATQITCTPPGATAKDLRSSGKPLINENCRIGSNDEIQVKGPTRVLGYLQNGELNLTLDEEGWFSTGDAGHFDEDGYLHVTGRLDNQFISGGENIQPEEIENHLCQIPGVLQAAAVPIDDEEFGQRPVAFIRAETNWNEAALKDTLRKTLPGYKIPSNILPWPENEIAEGMKVDRNKLIVYYMKAFCR